MAIDFRRSKSDLQKAREITLDLSRLLDKYEQLVNTTKATATTAKESQVLLELAKLPIDKLRDATEDSVRIESLRKY